MLQGTRTNCVPELDVRSKESEENVRYCSVEIAVDVFWAIVCSGIGYLLCTMLFLAIDDFLFDVRYPYLWSALLLLLVNLCHFIWGLFHIGDDFSDLAIDTELARHKPLLLYPNWHHQRLHSRAGAILLIGPSAYIQSAIQAYRRSRQSQS